MRVWSLSDVTVAALFAMLRSGSSARRTRKKPIAIAVEQHPAIAHVAHHNDGRERAVHQTRVDGQHAKRIAIGFVHIDDGLSGDLRARGHRMRRQSNLRQRRIDIVLHERFARGIDDFQGQRAVAEHLTFEPFAIAFDIRIALQFIDKPPRMARGEHDVQTVLHVHLMREREKHEGADQREHRERGRGKNERERRGKRTHMHQS